MRKLNIAIIGLGNIGSFLFKYLNENRKILTEKNNCLPVVKYVSARNKKKKRKISLGKSIWLDNYLDVDSRLVLGPVHSYLGWGDRLVPERRLPPWSRQRLAR